MIETKESGGALVFRVRVVPRASKTAGAGEFDGAANAELTRFLAKQLGVSAGSVEVVGGHTSKTKVVRAAGAKAEDLLRLAAAKRGVMSDE